MVELLAPAGNLPMVEGAVANGANAIYVGPRGWSRRRDQYEMSDEDVRAAIKIAHAGGAKLRVAFNTNMQSHEIAPMLEKMERFVSWGVDGAIMTDIGAIAEVHQRFPHLTIHASIGANILNNEDVRFYRSIGVSQVVADTKLTLRELASRKEQIDVGIEILIHANKCYTYLGKCWMSPYHRLERTTDSFRSDPQGAGLPERADRRRDRNPDPREQVLHLPREMLDVSLSPSRAHHGFLREGPVQGKPEPRRPRLPRLHGVVGALLRRGEVGEQRGPEERCVLPSGRHPAPDRPGGPVPKGAGARVSRASRGERGQVLPGSDRRLYRLPERRSLRPFAVAVPPRRNPDGAGHGPLRRDPATADGSAAASACDLSLLRKPVLPRQIQESLGHMPVAVRDLVAVGNVGVRRIRIVESLCDGQVVHHEIEDRPHARRCAERVAASQREQHPAFGVRVRPLEDSPEDDLVVARRRHELGERIVEMRICPSLDHEDIGAKVPQSGRKHLLEHLEVAPALGERLQRQIELQAATDSGAELADLTGTR